MRTARRSLHRLVRFVYSEFVRMTNAAKPLVSNITTPVARQITIIAMYSGVPFGGMGNGIQAIAATSRSIGVKSSRHPMTAGTRIFANFAIAQRI